MTNHRRDVPLPHRSAGQSLRQLFASPVQLARLPRSYDQIWTRVSDDSEGRGNRKPGYHWFEWRRWHSSWLSAAEVRWNDWIALPCIHSRKPAVPAKWYFDARRCAYRWYGDSLVAIDPTTGVPKFKVKMEHSTFEETAAPDCFFVSTATRLRGSSRP